MSASEPSNTEQDASRRREAIADMQRRLAQFGRLVSQVRDGLPEQHAQALGRIEQGMEDLAERIAAFGQEGQRPQAVGAPPAPAKVEADDPWDPQAAEALMQAYESADTDLTSASREGSARYRQWSREAEAAVRHAVPHEPLQDPATPDARFGEIAALLQRALADANPARSLAALDRRLDRFERRLDTALSDMALGSGPEGLKLIDAHVTELASHFDAIRQQLGRLDAMDGQLCDLTRALENHGQPRAGFTPLSEDDVAALIDTAAERAASRIAASLPTDTGGHARIDALESLLHDYIAERRQSEEVTAGILRAIEDALVRIADRVEAMEADKSPPAAPAESVEPGQGGVEIERDLLAEAYAEGARVLGQQDLEPSLHAADYVAADRREARETPPEPVAPLEADEPAPIEEGTRRELRASALRAKLKAQGTPLERSPESSGVDEAKAMLGQGRARTWTSTKVGSHRPNLLLGAAMAFLFGTGFMAVDSFLAGGKPAASKPRALEAQPAADTGRGDRAPASGDWTVRPAQIPQPPSRQPTPEAKTDDPSQEQPAPTRRLDRLQSGTAAASSIDATPVVLSRQDGDDSARAGAGAETSPTGAAARLRQAAAAGDAFAQFEIATRYAEGKGVAQDHREAFAWYERAATRGLAAAQFRLAAYFERGVGVAADIERAKVWYGRAADQGYVRAMHNLGVLTVGTGERQADYATAARWFRQAAERGLSDSQFNLAILHENGRGVPKDLQEAYKWFALAARSGDPVSARRLEQVRARLTPAELEAAEQKLAAWRPVATEAITGSINTRASR